MTATLLALLLMLLPSAALAETVNSQETGAESSASAGGSAVGASAAGASLTAPSKKGSSSSKQAVDPGVGTDAPASSHLKIPQTPEGFSTYDGGWITMAYHPSLAARVRVLQDEAEETRESLKRMLGEKVLSKVHVLIGRTAGEMETLAPKGAGFPRYASGVAYSELGLVLLTATSRFPGERLDMPEVFRHELAHVALHDAVSRDRIPRWFNEGFAIHASGEAETSRMQALWTASLSGNLLPFERLRRGFPKDDTAVSTAYAQAADMVRFLLRGGEEHRFTALIRRISQGQTFDEALADAYATDMFTLEREWREDVSRRYTFWPVIFGGSLIWVAGFGLLIWGFVRRKRRARQKMDRWAREEALEDARRKWAEAVFSRIPLRLIEGMRGGSSDETSRPLQPVEGSTNESGTVVGPAVRPVPTVEHDGERHTLH